jgi:hypothetical protein
MWRRFGGRLASLVVLIAAVALVAAVVPTYVGSTDAATRQPWVKYGQKYGPVGLPATTGEIARLDVPAGNYTVFAKLMMTSPNAQTTVQCNLTFGMSYDTAGATLQPNSSMTISMNVAGTQSNPGPAVLECSSNAPGAKGWYLRITAIKARTLKTVLMQ